METVDKSDSYDSVTNVCGCTLCSSVTISATTGIVSINPDKPEINISPNPSDGNALLNYHLQMQGEFMIYDEVGKLVRTHILKRDESSLSISDLNLKNGIYFYRVILCENKSPVSSGKFVIQK